MSASCSCAERNGSSANSDSSQRSSASASSRSSSASWQPLAQVRPRAGPRSASSRIASPRGCVAAIGSSGEIRSGRKSSRSKTTGPAAIAPAVASRSALTASASSPAASGGSPSSASSSRDELEHAEPVDVAPELGRHQPARLRPERRDLAGDRRAHADVAAELDGRAGREPDERRDRRVRARRAEERQLDLGVGGVEGLVVPVEAAAALGDRRRAAAAGSCGRARRPRSSRRPECAWAKIAAAGSRRRSSIAFRASGSRRSDGACSSTKPRTSGRYSYSDGPPRVGCSSKRERQLGPALDGERRQAEAAQRLVEVRCPKRHDPQLATGRRSPTRARRPVPAAQDVRRARRCTARLSAQTRRAVALPRRKRLNRRYAEPGVDAVAWTRTAPTEDHGSGPGWHAGHQYTVLFASPWPRERIGVPQRGHGRPGAAVHLLARLAAGVDRRSHQRRRRLERAAAVLLRHLGQP